MPRRKHKRPAPPRPIAAAGDRVAAANTMAREQARKAAATPAVWGLAPGLLELDTSADIAVAYTQAGERRSVRRLDAFDGLLRNGVIDAWAHQAAQRLLQDLAEFRGLGAAADRLKGLATGGQGRRHAGNMSLVTGPMMAAGDRLETALLQVWPAELREILLRIAEPIVWRDERRMALSWWDIDHRSVAGALEQLRRAYRIGPEPEPIHPFGEADLSAPQVPTSDDGDMFLASDGRIAAPLSPAQSGQPDVTAPTSAALWAAIVDQACRYAGVDKAAFDGPGRAKPVSRARAIAAYLATVEFELPDREVARLSGRDHRGLERAVAAIEEAREDAGLDADLDELAGDLRRRMRGEPELRRVA